MKRKRCMCCFNPAVYQSGNHRGMRLCEECYMSFADDYEASFEDEFGMSFDDYYDIQEIEEED